ncbi:MAG: ATP-binding protein [Eubacteriales bacterium]
MVQNIYNTSYTVSSRDFTNAGNASRKIKKTLQQIGIDNKVIRRVSIATYEAEMNIAIHSNGGEIFVTVDDHAITILSIDKGPGIENIALAMTEGFSTADKEIQEMGFGAGMGLPNMKFCADNFEISSTIDEGTNIRMYFKIRR